MSREQTQEKLLELLAYCVSRTVDGVEFKNDNDPQRLQRADAVARALGCDMTKWFTPTASNFYSRVSKARIADALAEAGKPVDADGLKQKKVDLASQAEASTTGTGWLPEPVRVSPRIRQTDGDGDLHSVLTWSQDPADDESDSAMVVNLPEATTK